MPPVAAAPGIPQTTLVASSWATTTPPPSAIISPPLLPSAPIPFLDYTRALGGRSWPSPEDIAVAIQDDVNNELVARWTRITVTTDANSTGALAGHSITVEDRQPQWDNRSLLDGLRRY